LVITKFPVKICLFSGLWQLRRGKYIVSTATEYCKEKVFHTNVFRAILEKFGENILCTPRKLPSPTKPMLRCTVVNSGQGRINHLPNRENAQGLGLLGALRFNIKTLLY